MTTSRAEGPCPPLVRRTTRPDHPASAALAVPHAADYAHLDAMTDRAGGAPPPEAASAPLPAPAVGNPIPLPSLPAADRPEGEATPGADREMVTALHAIASHLVRIDGRLDAIESRLDAIESRLDAIESRLDAIESRKDALEESVYAPNRVDALETSGKAPEERTDRLDRLVERLADPSDPLLDAIIALRTEMQQEFESLRRSYDQWRWAVIVPLTVVAVGSFFR